MNINGHITLRTSTCKILSVVTVQNTCTRTVPVLKKYIHVHVNQLNYMNKYNNTFPVWRSVIEERTTAENENTVGYRYDLFGFKSFV